MITRLCIVLSFALMVIGCSVQKEPIELKAVGVTLVKEIVRSRIVGTGYREFTVWLYVDDNKNEYELNRYEGVRATIYLSK